METENMTERERRIAAREYWLDRAEHWFTKALTARDNGNAAAQAIYTSYGQTAMAQAALNRPQAVTL